MDQIKNSKQVKSKIGGIYYTGLLVEGSFNSSDTKATYKLSVCGDKSRSRVEIEVIKQNDSWMLKNLTIK